MSRLMGRSAAILSAALAAIGLAVAPASSQTSAPAPSQAAAPAAVTGLDHQLAAVNSWQICAKRR